MRRILPFLLLIGSACALLHCDRGGGSSETEGLTLSGRIVDSALRPLPNARVALFPTVPPAHIYSSPAPSDSARADALGRYTLRGVAPGSYSLLITAATAEGASLSALRTGLEVTGDDSLTPLALVPSSSLSGRLPPGFPYSYAKHVILAGTPFSSPVAADGSFHITGITKGTYALALVLRSNDVWANPSVIGALDTVEAVPGQPVAFAPLQVPALPGTGPFLVDDFSDCDMRTGLKGLWWTANDGADSRVPVFTMSDPQDGTGGCAARFTFRFGHAAPYPFLGIGAYFRPYTDSLPRAFDLTGATGISFRIKGTGVAMEVLLQSSVSGLVSGQGFDIAEIPADWTTYTFDFATDMKDTYDSTDIRSWRQRRRAITHIQFDALPRAGIDSGEIWIDDLRILRP